MRNFLLYVLFFAVVPNLFFWILSQYIYFSRAIIDIDYLLLGMILYYVPFPIGYLFFLVIFFLDAIFSFLPGFYFSGSNIIRALQHALHLKVSYIYLLFPLTGIILYILLKPLKRISTKVATWTCFFIILPLVTVDIFYNKMLSYNIATSSGYRLLKAVIEIKNEPDMLMEKNASAASEIIFEHLDNEKLPNHIVLIVVESLAHFNDPVANELQFMAINNEKVSDKYEIQMGVVPFKGVTVPGEIRELCLLKINTVHPDLNRLPVEACIVEQLKDRGFHTTAINGFHGVFFNLFDLYATLGFEEALFINEIDDALGSQLRCGYQYFKGACDTQILNLVHAQLLEPSAEKSFIYWLTLNTHLPIKAPAQSDLNCELSHSTAKHEDICASVQLHDRLFKLITNMMMDPHLPPTLFVLVGDHAPPFTSLQVRELINQEEVPYIVLWPKA